MCLLRISHILLSLLKPQKFRMTDTHTVLIRPHNARLIYCAARRTEAFTQCTCLVKSNPVFLCSPSQPLTTTTTSLVTAVVYMVSPGVESPVTYDLAWTVDCKSQQSNSLLIDADSLIWLMAPQHSLWWMDGCRCMCVCVCVCVCARARGTAATCACRLRYSMIRPWSPGHGHVKEWKTPERFAIETVL